MNSDERIRFERITGKIIVQTGLHIGGGSETIEIGGMDNPVVKNPHSGLPYIPGSSLKGKMRSLMEWKYGLVDKNKGHPCNCAKDDCIVCVLFGSSPPEEKKTEESNKEQTTNTPQIQSNDKRTENKAREGKPSIILVRDAKLNDTWEESCRKKDLAFTENKSENVINRIDASATPRHMERVPPGAIFDFEVVIKYLYTDVHKNTDYKDYILQAMALVEQDALGGSGSRGYGKVRFDDIRIHKTLNDESGVKIEGWRGNINKMFPSN